MKSALAQHVRSGAESAGPEAGGRSVALMLLRPPPLPSPPPSLGSAFLTKSAPRAHTASDEHSPSGDPRSPPGCSPTASH